MAIKVRVRDFQSIEDASITIDGLTVLTGTNNAGKSALFRAIRGVFTNAPGHAFVRTGTPHSTVELEFDDGQSLTWMKGKGVNTYIINGKKLEKVDRGVPPEVRAFGIESFRVGDSEFWPQIAPQVTGVVFLLNETGSVIAEAVADVERVKQLTTALKACDADRKVVRADLKVRTETATSLAEQRTSFSGLDVLVERLGELDQRHNTATRLERAVVNLERLANKYQTAFADVEALREVEQVEALVPVEARVVEVERLRQELVTLRSLADRYHAAVAVAASLEGLAEVEALVPSEERISHIGKFRHGIGITVDLVSKYDKAQEELGRAAEVDTALANVSLNDELVEKLRKFTKGVQTARQLQGRHAKSMRDLAAIEVEVAAAETQRAEAEAQVVKLLGSSSECPTCGQTLRHVHP